MRSGSSSSNKARKQINDAKTVIIISSMETGCYLCLQRLSYKSTEKLFKKDLAQKPKFIFKNIFFKAKIELRLQHKAMDTT